MLITLISSLLSIFIFFLGLLIFLRNSRNKTNILFFVVSLLSAAWSLTFAMIEQPNDVILVTFLNNAAFVLGLLLLLSVVIFSYYFPRERPKRYLKFYSLILIPTVILSATPLIGGEVKQDETGSYVFTMGPLALQYVVVMLVGVGLIAYNLFSSRRSYSPVQRSQMQLVALGFNLSFLTGVFLSTALPVFLPDTRLDDLSPFALVFLIGFSAAAVNRYKLFDFRAIVVRAATYLFSGIILAFLVVLSILNIGNRLLFEEDPLSGGQKVFLGIVMSLFVLAYPVLRGLFDKLSSKFFFRSDYDTKQVLGNYNSQIVGSIDTKKLANILIATLKETIQATKAVVSVQEAGLFESETGLIDKDYEVKLTELLKRHHLHKGTSVIQLDELEEGTTDHIFTDLRRKDFSLVARLGTGKNLKGFILVGQKQTGTLFTSADVALVEILVNQLMLALSNALQYEEIEQFNKTLTSKIQQATSDLRKTNEKLKQMDETKDEFISMASHQLRTPLTSVKGYLSMVLEGDAGKLNDQQTKLLSQAFTSSQRMVYLIADLLNVSRLRTGKFVIETAPTDLPEVIKGEISQLTETAAARGLTLTFNEPKDFPVLKLDETKIRQVIMNFVDNAIYYTPAGGHINIELTASDRAVDFKVIDDGLGVPKSEQHHLFNKFYRAENAKRARPDGTGLGLFMAKKVVIAQGGAIIFESKEGLGSTFGFTFPRHDLEVKKDSH